MRQKNRKRPSLKKTVEQRGKIDSPASPEAATLNGSSRFMEWLKNVLFGVLVASLLLGLVELGLRFAWTPAANTTDPYVGFAGIDPLFVTKDGVVSTSPKRLKYFNEVSFSEKKPEGSLRIFSFGGSTTYGHPFDGRTSFSRWLQDLLVASCPDRTIETLNLGGISYASYRIVPIVKEALQYKPDLMIIYTGHNEFLERRSYANLLSQGSTVIWIRAHLANLRIYKLLEASLALLTNGKSPASQIGPDQGNSSTTVSDGRTVLNSETTAILDKSAGLDLYFRDEEFSRGVVDHFTYNLRNIVSLCKNSRVPLILVEPPSNLKDFSPFKSEHDSRLTQSQRTEIDKGLEAIGSLLQSHDYQRAISKLSEIEAMDPLYALSYFLKGQTLHGQKRYDEARLCFVKSKNLDVCPLRATEPIIEAIREIAKEKDVRLISFCDFVNSYSSAKGNESGIPGNESFLDHVHPSIELHQALAELLLIQIHEMGLVKGCKLLSNEEIQSIMARGLTLLDQSVFTVRDLNLAKTLRWAGKKKEARQALLRIADREIDNPEIHKMLGSFALEDLEFPEAISEFRQAIKLSGGEPELKLSLAIALFRSGKTQEAREVYEEILASGKAIPEAYANLTILLLETGHFEQADDIIRAGLTKYPDSATLYSPYALTLAVSGQALEAIEWMRKAVSAEPGDPIHYYNLAGMYALTHDKNLAFRNLNIAIDRGYRNLAKILKDPVFSELINEPEFDKIKIRLQ
jgi:tetratricopeptide (TPR) repeat protein